MTAWLQLCRDAVADVQRVLLELPTSREREPIVGTGRGGDQTVAVDAAAEEAIVRRLEVAHRDGESFRLVSEELGERSFGDGSKTVVVVDPIDGSVNAKRGLPYFAVSIAVAEGETMDDVAFGYVYDFGSREEWTATRGAGAYLNDQPLGEIRPKDPIELLAFEATKTASVAKWAPRFEGIAERLRIPGSLALSLCNLAAGRVDAVCSLRGARAVDIAAAQLLVRECGLAIELPEAPPFGAAPLDVEARSRVVAGATPEVCRALAAAFDA